MANLNLQNSSNIKVVQNGSDISMDFQTTGAFGNITSLQTSDTSNLVNAINELHNDIFYKANDTYAQYGFICSGHITGGSTSVVFTLPLPKRLTYITSVQITTFTARIRGVGGYINGSSAVNYLGTGYTVSTTLKDNIISISITSSSALSGATNNTPIVVYLDSFSMTFNG